MSELHLDLCRQSTKHLGETIETLKENLRILEVFINSGLSEGSKSSVIGSGNEDLPLMEGNGSGGHVEESRIKRTTTPLDHHKQCCCMCPSRLGMFCCNSGYHGRGSRVSNNSSAASYRRRPVSMPRLNRTASLRRDNAIEKAQAQMQTKHSTR